MRSNSIFRTLAAVVGAGLVLAACGGGGGGSSPPPPAPPPPPADPLGAVGTLAEEQDRLFQSIGVDIIAAAYAGMQSEMANLEADVDSYCASPATNSLDDVLNRWRSAMSSWQSAEVVRFGPVEEDNRRLRIQFFPDNNDAVENNVTQILNGTQAIDEALIAGSAVGAQGLPALEYVLFTVGGLDDPTNGPRRCEFVVAVASNLSTMSDQLASAWDVSGQLLADFTSASGDFADRTEVLTAILESLAVESEFVADEKLTRPINVGAPAAESFRSEHSLENLQANLASLRLWLTAGESDTDYGVIDYLRRAHDAANIGNQLDSQLGDAEQNLDSLNASFESVLLGTATGDPNPARVAMQDLADSFIDAAVAADVSLGFNNQDGD
ncbi:MAG: imelysin family protein [Pseudomonadota bacterium]